MRLYRDVWERKPPSQEYLRIARTRCVRTTVDYPEYEGFLEYINGNLGTVGVTAPVGPPNISGRLYRGREKRQEGE